MNADKTRVSKETKKIAASRQVQKKYLKQREIESFMKEKDAAKMNWHCALKEMIEEKEELEEKVDNSIKKALDADREKSHEPKTKKVILCRYYHNSNTRKYCMLFLLQS